MEGFIEGMQRVKDTQVAKKRLMGVVDPEIDRRNDYSVENMLSFQIVSSNSRTAPVRRQEGFREGISNLTIALTIMENMSA